MKKLALIFCFFIALNINAQAPASKSSEWDVLDKTFVSLIESISKNSEQSFKAIALPQIDCPDCAGVDNYTAQGAFVPVAIFYKNITKEFSKSPIYKALATRGYRFSSVTMKNFKPSYLPASYPKDLKIYDVWIDTYLPGEVSKNHNGTKHAFRFIKVNGKFRLYGLIST